MGTALDLLTGSVFWPACICNVSNLEAVLNVADEDIVPSLTCNEILLSWIVRFRATKIQERFVLYRLSGEAFGSSDSGSGAG